MQKFIFSHSRSYKSKNKMSSELGPAESTFLLGPHVMEKERSVISVSFYMHTSFIRLGSHLYDLQ